MKLRYTPEARADLRGITLHYREINVDLAKRVLRLIRARCHRLSRFPYGAQRLDSTRTGDLRRAVADPYLIVYRVRNGVLEVVRRIHGARDLGTILPRDPASIPTDE